MHRAHGFWIKAETHLCTSAAVVIVVQTLTLPGGMKYVRASAAFVTTNETRRHTSMHKSVMCGPLCLPHLLSAPFGNPGMVTWRACSLLTAMAAHSVSRCVQLPIPSTCMPFEL